MDLRLDTAYREVRATLQFLERTVRRAESMNQQDLADDLHRCLSDLRAIERAAERKRYRTPFSESYRQRPYVTVNP
jgi:hypothetical protein